MRTEKQTTATRSAAQLNAPAPTAGRRSTPESARADLLKMCLHPHDQRLAGRPALITRAGSGWTKLTYRELNARCRAVAGWLRGRGIVSGDRVALIADASGEWVAALLGALAASAVAVPLDPKLTREELGAALERIGPAAVIVQDDLADSITRIIAEFSAGAHTLVISDVHALPDDGSIELPPAAGDGAPAVIVWTSGTTSAAKGVALSSGNVAYVISELIRTQGVHADDRLLSVLPGHHVLELSCGILSGLAAGASVSFAGTLMPHEIVDALAQRRITKLVAVPLLLEVLQRRLQASLDGTRDRLAAVDAVYCGGAALDVCVIEFFAAIGIPIYQGYGLTETSPTIAMNAPGADRAGSVGRPLRNSEIRIEEADAAAEGEILVRSPGVMLGYWRDEALTRRVIDSDGWLHTGDLGHVDDDGFLWITGRSKNVIVLDSGKKVHPEHVEAALAESRLIAESCVLGWRPTAAGRAGAEQVCAVVVPAGALAAEQGAQATERRMAEEIRLLTRTLSGYKRPTVVRVLTRPLPRSAKGAVRVSAVRELIDEQERGL